MSPTNNGARARFSGCYSGILVKREFGCREYVGSLCVIRDRARHKGESAVHYLRVRARACEDHQVLLIAYGARGPPELPL